MIVRSNVAVQIAGNGHADLHATDRSLGHPASDPVGADGCHCGRAPHRRPSAPPAGFGILGGGYGDKAWLEQETAKLADVSDPFGIGFITWSLAKQPALLDIALEAGPRAIMLSFGDPKPFAPRIKSSGALLICQVQDEAMARQALDAGADILIAQGTEAGGHGASRTTIDIVPAIVDLAAGRVPVAAAGGIGDGRGLAAMMMLGASGVLLGTRFYASQECDGAEEAKRRICAATSGNSVRGIIFDLSRNNVWPAPFTGRCLINDHARRWMGREVELHAKCQSGRRRICGGESGRAISISPPSLPASPSG